VCVWGGYVHTPSYEQTLNRFQYDAFSTPNVSNFSTKIILNNLKMKFTLVLPLLVLALSTTDAQSQRNLVISGARITDASYFDYQFIPETGLNHPLEDVQFSLRYSQAEPMIICYSSSLSNIPLDPSYSISSHLPMVTTFGILFYPINYSLGIWPTNWGDTLTCQAWECDGGCDPSIPAALPKSSQDDFLGQGQVNFSDFKQSFSTTVLFTRPGFDGLAAQMLLECESCNAFWRANPNYIPNLSSPSDSQANVPSQNQNQNQTPSSHPSPQPPPTQDLFQQLINDLTSGLTGQPPPPQQPESQPPNVDPFDDNNTPPPPPPQEEVNIPTLVPAFPSSPPTPVAVVPSPPPPLPYIIITPPSPPSPLSPPATEEEDADVNSDGSFSLLPDNEAKENAKNLAKGTVIVIGIIVAAVTLAMMFGLTWCFCRKSICCCCFGWRKVAPLNASDSNKNLKSKGNSINAQPMGVFMIQEEEEEEADLREIHVRASRPQQVNRALQQYGASAAVANLSGWNPMRK